jgi:phosphonate transport system permease protein
VKKATIKVLVRYKTGILLFAVLTALTWGAAVVTRVNLAALLKRAPRALELIGHMVPPAWDAFPNLLAPALETVQIAFVGTVFGVLLALGIGFLAAGNITPNRMLRTIARGLLAAERALPDLITLLLFVAIVGLGPFPGVMAVAVSSVGMLGKLFADALEEVDPRPVEALEAIGATKAQVVRYAVLPQVLPSLVANSLFRFDVNIRMSIFLGAVGAGGIGFELISAVRLLEYQNALSAIIVVWLLVLVCERISDLVRAKVLGQAVLR